MSQIQARIFDVIYVLSLKGSCCYAVLKHVNKVSCAFVLEETISVPFECHYLF